METERSMNADPETVNPAPGFARPLMDWYQAHHRDLPFRRDREPYHIWVSEIMAQQTRIEAMVHRLQKVCRIACGYISSK